MVWDGRNGLPSLPNHVFHGSTGRTGPTSRTPWPWWARRSKPMENPDQPPSESSFPFQHAGATYLVCPRCSAVVLRESQGQENGSPICLDCTRQEGVAVRMDVR